MEQKLIKAFQAVRYQTNSSLSGKIWHTIVLREGCITRAKLLIFSAIGFCSLIGIVPALKTLSSDLVQSGFFEYISIGLSGSVFYFWKEIILSVLESLPIKSITMLLTLILFFFLSLKYVSKQINQLSLSF